MKWEAELEKSRVYRTRVPISLISNRPSTGLGIAVFYHMGEPGTQLTGRAHVIAAADSMPSHQEHVVFMVHGLSGSARHWEVVKEKLATVLDPNVTLIHVSIANEGRKVLPWTASVPRPLFVGATCPLAPAHHLKTFSGVLAYERSYLSTCP